jgi:hypothetical protein
MTAPTFPDPDFPRLGRIATTGELLALGERLVADLHTRLEQIDALVASVAMEETSWQRTLHGASRPQRASRCSG